MFLQDGSFPFGSVLTVKDIVDILSQECVETCDRLFTPLVTLCTFLSQIHSDDSSCCAVVSASTPLASPNGWCRTHQKDNIFGCPFEFQGELFDCR